jgi:peptidoglycan/LPS O-acetylase OafA/YrhL
LDASRFFAFVLVFLGHCFVSTSPAIRSSGLFQSVYDWGKVGVLGLEYFFVLSSFLISIIILEEKDQTATFNISNFLIRRSLRVWPLYFLILLIGFSVITAAQYVNLDVNPLPPWPYLFFFLVNYYIISHGTEFLFFIAFLWSISVEEQFYLIWSVFMKFIHRYFALFCITLILISLIFRFYYATDDANLYFNTISALGNFGIGGLLALAVFKKHRIIESIISWKKPYVISIYLLILLSVAFYHQLMALDNFRIAGRLIYSLLFAYLILEQSMGKHHWFNFGRISLFNYLGKISYGLYCFHGVIITLFLQIIRKTSPEQSYLDVFLLFPLIIFILTMLLSHLSYRYFELYFLNLKQKFYTFQP